jgi:hypothetical protein
LGADSPPFSPLNPFIPLSLHLSSFSLLSHFTHLSKAKKLNFTGSSSFIPLWPHRHCVSRVTKLPKPIGKWSVFSAAAWATMRYAWLSSSLQSQSLRVWQWPLTGHIIGWHRSLFRGVPCFMDFSANLLRQYLVWLFVYGKTSQITGFNSRANCFLCISQWCRSFCWWFFDPPLRWRHHAVHIWSFFGHCSFNKSPNELQCHTTLLAVASNFS